MANGQVPLAVNLSRWESDLKEFLQSPAHLEKIRTFYFKATFAFKVGFHFQPSTNESTRLPSPERRQSHPAAKG
jgi:hypothetical protein